MEQLIFDSPIRAHPSLPAGYRSGAVAAALATLGAYLLTLSPDLTWTNAAYDGPELVIASSTLGIAHPPGYPTYVILGKAFSLLPIGTIAFRYNLFSAIAVTVAVGLCVLIIGLLFPRVRPYVAIAAALLLGFTPLVWSQAIVAEVYGLNLLAVAAFLLAWARLGTSRCAGFLLGLAITTHLTSLLLLPGFLLRIDRHSRTAFLGLIAGLAPLLLLPWLASGNSPVIWGRPSDPAGWWWLVSGRLYGANYQPAFDIDHLTRIMQTIMLGPAGLLWASNRAGADSIAGVVIADRTRPTPAVFGFTAMLYLAFSLYYKTPDAAVLLLPAILLVVIIAAPLLDRLGPAVLIFPVGLGLFAYQTQTRTWSNQPRLAALQLLQSAPDQAILLTPGDRTIFTLLYFQQLEGERPDLHLIDANLFAFDWYRDRIAGQYPELTIPEEDDLGLLLRENSENHTICLAGLVVPPTGYPGLKTAGTDVSGSPPYLRCIEDLP